MKLSICIQKGKEVRKAVITLTNESNAEYVFKRLFELGWLVVESNKILMIPDRRSRLNYEDKIEIERRSAFPEQMANKIDRLKSKGIDPALVPAFLKALTHLISSEPGIDPAVAAACTILF